MGKYRIVIAGAGRIGSGFAWHDLEYTHAGSVNALKDRVELVGFIEPNEERSDAAQILWKVPVYPDCKSGFDALQPDIVIIATQPGQQEYVLNHCVSRVKGALVEKPYMAGKYDFPIQTNYLRRADPEHQRIAAECYVRTIHVWAKNDLHTWPHFMDLARWWEVNEVQYNIIDGPCSYRAEGKNLDRHFDNGGINPAECMKGMLSNLLDAIEGKAELWSPPY